MPNIRESPYMLLAAPVLENHRKDGELVNVTGLDKLKVMRSDLPADTHVDYSARIQTVNERDNQLYHKLVREFEEKTGYPVIINTSYLMFVEN